MNMTTRWRNTRLGGGLALLAALLTTVTAMARQGPPPRQAGLVVVHGDGRVVTRCVTFTEEAISGADLLTRSGFAVVLSPYGGLGYGVCAIEGEGCGPGQDCFCQCRGATCAYWVYSHRQPDGSWALSGVGASTWMVHDGDVDGWVWGDGSTAPPILSFDAICRPSAEVTTPGAQPTATACPTPIPATATSAPTATPTSKASPTSPPTPSLLPSVTATPSPLPSNPATASPTPPPFPPSNYILFAALVLLLAGGLVRARLRRG